jgi:hypothetical protein
MFALNNISKISLVTVQVAASQEVLSFMELVTITIITRVGIAGLVSEGMRAGRAGWNPSVQDLCHTHCVKTISGHTQPPIKSLMTTPPRGKPERSTSY